MDKREFWFSMAVLLFIIVIATEMSYLIYHGKMQSDALIGFVMGFLGALIIILKDKIWEH